MVAARVGKNGYVRQIDGNSTNAEDTRARYVPWTIFKVLWGLALNTDTKEEEEEEELTGGRMSMCRVCVYHVGQESRKAFLRC